MIRGIDGARTHFQGSHLSEHDRREMRGPVTQAPAPTQREKMTAGIVADLVELGDADLARVRRFVAIVLGGAKETGTERKIDGATLAREQAEREESADGFGCHHAAPCEGACPVPSFPPVDGFDTREEAQEECDAANEPIGAVLKCLANPCSVCGHAFGHHSSGCEIALAGQATEASVSR